MSTSDSSVSETSEEQWSRSYTLIDSLLHSHTSPLSSFQKKLKKAVAVLENTLRLYLPDRVTHTHTLTHTLTHDDGNGTSVSVSDGKSPVFVSFNGGKDATVVLHLLRYVLHKHDLTALLGTAIKIIYFDDPHQFPEIEEFIRHTLTALRVEPVTFKCSFKEGIERAIDEYGLKAVLMGVRMGDPYTDDAEHFHPSTANYPAFMRVYPVLQWEYADVWTFLRECKLPYCSLYDLGYTSIGNVKDTVPNPALLISNDSLSKSECVSEKRSKFLPAHMLTDSMLERECRK